MKLFIFFLLTFATYGDVKIINEKNSKMKKVQIMHWSTKVEKGIKITTESVHISIEHQGKTLSKIPVRFHIDGKNMISAIFWVDKSELKNIKITINGFGASPLIDVPYQVVFKYDSKMKKFVKAVK